MRFSEVFLARAFGAHSGNFVSFWQGVRPKTTLFCVRHLGIVWFLRCPVPIIRSKHCLIIKVILENFSVEDRFHDERCRKTFATVTMFLRVTFINLEIQWGKQLESELNVSERQFCREQDRALKYAPNTDVNKLHIP